MDDDCCCCCWEGKYESNSVRLALLAVDVSAEKSVLLVRRLDEDGVLSATAGDEAREDAREDARDDVVSIIGLNRRASKSFSLLSFEREAKISSANRTAESARRRKPSLSLPLDFNPPAVELARPRLVKDVGAAADAGKNEVPFWLLLFDDDDTLDELSFRMCPANSCGLSYGRSNGFNFRLYCRVMLVLLDNSANALQCNCCCSGWGVSAFS